MRLSLLLLAVLILSVPAEAQYRRGHAFAKQGDLALTIGVTGLEDLALRPYEGGLGLRYRAADRTVLGAAFGLEIYERESERTSRSGDADLTSADGGEGQRISLAAWMEQHVGRSRRTVSPFVGAGVQVSTFNREDERLFVSSCDGDDCPREERSTADEEGLTVGGGLILGAEVRLARGVTLGGAYTLGAEYARIESTFTRTSNGETAVSGGESDTWRIGVGTTQVGLSVYF